MQLFNGIRHNGDHFVGLWLHNEARDLTAHLVATDHKLRHAAHSTDALISAKGEKFKSFEELLEGVDLKSAPSIVHYEWQTPILRPGKIIALVRNYRKHAEEFGAEPPPAMRWFAKFPSTMIAHSGDVLIPEWLPGPVHHEVELGVVIGKPARHVEEADALTHVAGYTILNDVSARGVQQTMRDETMPWMPAKNLDTFAPCGAFLTSAAAVGDPQNLRVTCTVNGQVRQDGNSSEMLHSVASTIAQLSKWLTLESGDIIATGTPAGVGPLVDCDYVECEIEKVGFLHHSVFSGR